MKRWQGEEEAEPSSAHIFRGCRKSRAHDQGHICMGGCGYPQVVGDESGPGVNLLRWVSTLLRHACKHLNPGDCFRLSPILTRVFP